LTPYRENSGFMPYQENIEMNTLFNNLRQAGRNNGATIAQGEFSAAECKEAADTVTDMLAALEIADVALRAHGAGSSWDREQVLAAIAKAKGVQS
jgi:hypothetical protein